MKFDSLNMPNFTIEGDMAEGDATIRITGEVDMEDPSQVIRPYLDRLHASLIDNEIGQISVDFRKLAFMNSSGIKEFVQWIMKQKGTESARYRIRIVYSDTVLWQSRSLPVLQKLRPDLVDLSPITE